MAAQNYVQIRQAIRRLTDPEHRREAERFLLDRPEIAYSALLQTLESAASEQLCAAVAVLGKLGDPRATSPLRRLALRDSGAVARAAVIALGDLAHSAAVPALADALICETQDIRIEAALALARLGSAADSNLATLATHALERLRPDDAPALCEALIWRLEPPARDTAFIAALTANAPQTIEALLRIIATTQNAQSARDTLRHPQAVAPLLQMFSVATAEQIAPVLAELVSVVGAPLDEQIVAALIAALDEAGSNQRAAIAEALRVSGQVAIAVARQRLLTAPRQERLRWADLLDLLGWSPTPDRAGAWYWIAKGEWARCIEAGHEAIGPLVETFEQDAPQRELAANALCQLGWEPPDLPTRWHWLIALQRWDELVAAGKAAIEPLAHALRDERANAAEPRGVDAGAVLRVAMTNTLGRIPHADAVPALLAALRLDPAAPVRAEALRALEARGAEGYAALMQALRRELDLIRDERAAQGRAQLRRDLVIALGRSSATQESLDLLLRVVGRDPAPQARTAARDVLLSQASRDRQAVIVAALAHLDGPVTPELGEALRRLGPPLLDRLLALVDCPDLVSINRAIAGFYAIARAGANVLYILHEPLLTGSAQTRRAVAELLDRLGIEPEQPDAQVAYWLAKGQFERCESLGEAATPILLEALPLYDWQTAGQIAQSALRLGLDPDHPAIQRVLAELTELSEAQDERVIQTLLAERGLATERQISLNVSYEQVRITARKLIESINQAQIERLTHH